MEGGYQWEAIGAIGEILGALAVFVTLGYLAMQVRLVGRQMSLAANQARWDALRELLLTRVANADFVGLEDKVVDVLERQAGGVLVPPFLKMLLECGLTSAQATQINAMQWAYWFYREQGVLFVDALSPGQRVQFDAAIRVQLSPGTIEFAWYQAHRDAGALNPDAVRYIESVLSQPPASSRPQ